jgi:hypothetical protein
MKYLELNFGVSRPWRAATISSTVASRQRLNLGPMGNDSDYMKVIF